MLIRSNMICPVLIMIVQLCTSQIYEESPTVESQMMDDSPVEFSRNPDMELSPFHVLQLQDRKASLIGTEALSANLHQPDYTFMRRAEDIHQNMPNPEGQQRGTSSTLYEELMAMDTGTDSMDMDLGRLLACGDLGPVSIDDIDVAPLSVDTEIETLSDYTYQVENVLMRDLKSKPNTPAQSLHLHTPEAFSNSSNKTLQSADENGSEITDCPTFSGPACGQSIGGIPASYSPSFIKFSNFKHVFVNHTVQKSFQCDICPKQFRTSSSYQRHRRTHTGEKPYHCDVCHKQFFTSNNCQRHRRTHTGEKPYQCDICSKQFAVYTSYQRHQRIHTGEKSFPCDICAKQFRTSSNCQRHRGIHTGEKPFQCDLCSKQFLTRSSYQRHRRVHTGEKPFLCDICPKQFRTSCSYKAHRRVHTGQKPFQCDLCAKQFRTSNNYRAHRRTHTGEKPFQCDLCPKKFRTNNGYQTHRRTHTGEKPFQCDICRKEFSDQSSYHRHRRIDTGEKPYICNWCNQNYCLKPELVRHVRKCLFRNVF